MGIPAKIHQTHESLNSLPEELKQNIINVKKINSDHHYYFFNSDDRDDYISTYYSPEIISAYRSINPVYGAARADLFKYLVIYQEGGVYLDIKSTTTRPLSQVLLPTDSYILSQWDNSASGKHPGWGLFSELSGITKNGEYQTWFLAAEPKHPFLSLVIDTVMSRIQNFALWTKRGTAKQVIFTTGPIAYTIAIESIRQNYPHRLVAAEQDLGMLYTTYPTPRFHQSVYSSYCGKTEPLIIHNWWEPTLYPLALRCAKYVQKIIPSLFR